jgi:hypothetical protein
MDGLKINESDEYEPNKDNDYIYVDSDDKKKLVHKHNKFMVL